MSALHTKGPWVAKIPERKFKRPSVEIDSARSFVCDVWGWGEEVKANARLIAAAPELLSELANLLDCVQTYAPKFMHGIPTKEHVQNARAAIAKATGETK